MSSTDQSPAQGGPPSDGHSVEAERIAVAKLDFVRTHSKAGFDWDPDKNLSNAAKHGLSLAAATAIWAGPVVTLPSIRPGETRHLAIGLIDGRHWTVIFVPRYNHIRLISARRSRENEKALFESHLPRRQDDGRQSRTSL